MHPLLERVYFGGPPALRDVMATVYGWQLHRERYGGGFRRYAAELQERERADATDIAAYQAAQVRALVAHAAETVPFYTGWLRAAGVTAADVQTPADLARLPCLDKETVRAAGVQLRSRTFSDAQCVTVNTSGTTGTTLQITVDQEGRRRNYAFFARAKRWAGIGELPRSATFGGRAIVPPGRTRPPFWVTNLRARNTQFSSFHLSAETAAAYARKLVALQPEFIHSYPSALYVLATLAREQGFALPQPHCIMTSSETVFPNMRAAIETAFGCPVVDQYGGAEQAAFVSQCGAGSYHVHADFGVVEIIDREGRPCGPGELGEIIATGFTNRAMPLLRYRTGDSARWAAGPCACGSAFPVLGELLGRMDDLLIAPDGRYIGRLDPIFKGLTSVREAQVAQTALDAVEVRLVRGAEYRPADEADIRHELAARLGPSMRITFRYVEAVPRTRAGKFRAVVREVPLPAVVAPGPRA